MNKAHDHALTLRLEDSWLNGCSHVTWKELYWWYDVERLAKRTYRDLEERWQDITGGNAGRLQYIEGRGGLFLFGEKSPKLVADPQDED